MTTRREILIQAAIASAAVLAGQERPLFAMASQPTTPVDFDVPPGACDCHQHIFDPQRFPFFAGRTYTPEPATVPELEKMHRALHIQRAVIVQPSVYGTDNACTLHAIRQIGPSARGVAAIDDKTTDAHLDAMHQTGIRGIRLSLETGGEENESAALRLFKNAAERMRRRNRWHIQIYTRPSIIAAIKAEVAASPVPVVFDHFGGAQAALGTRQPGFDALLDLVQSGRAYVKLSAPYRASKLAPDYPDVAPLAEALIAANPRRVLWGTDWPHPDTISGWPPDEVTPLYQIDDGRLFNLFATRVPDSSLRNAILVENPAGLYGF